jgi:hypothetical protein
MKNALNSTKFNEDGSRLDGRTEVPDVVLFEGYIASLYDHLSMRTKAKIKARFIRFELKDKPS